MPQTKRPTFSKVRRFRGLLLEIEFLGDLGVSLWVLLGEILHVGLSIGYHREESSAGMLVLIVLLEVLREFLDLCGKEADLDLWGARVLCMDAGVLNYFCFLNR